MQDTQILRTTYKVSDFVSWARAGTLELSPSFQRRPVWKKGAKSYLIDTIIRGLPMPIIFLRDKPADTKTYQSKREVVDGQQRIRTILSFIDKKLLKDYKPDRDDFSIDEIHNKNLAGKSFSSLREEDKKRILEYQFSAQVFSPETDDREILQIFARMNATGLKLNAQELRNAEFFGEFKTIAYELATEQLNRWRDWRIFTDDQIARMMEVELVSEFMLLSLDGVLEKNQNTINDYYKKNEKDFLDKREVASRFRVTMDTLEQFLSGDEAKSFRNRTIFFALFAAVHGLQYGLRDPARPHQKLAHAKPSPLRPQIVAHIKKSAAAIKSGNVPKDVSKASRGATAHAKQRRTIIGYLVGAENDPCPRNP